ACFVAFHGKRGYAGFSIRKSSVNSDNQEFVPNFIASLKTFLCIRKACRNIHPCRNRRQLLRLLKISLKTGELFSLKAGTSAGNVRFNSRRKQSVPCRKRNSCTIFRAYRIENPLYSS
uniref:hypothetical protein n=1 Tax=Akkermansia muciniphila TaxID=239935 RepID=UPI004029C252